MPPASICLPTNPSTAAHPSSSTSLPTATMQAICASPAKSVFASAPAIVRAVSFDSTPVTGPVHNANDGLCRQFTGPYCVSVDVRMHCVRALQSSLAERRGEKRWDGITDAWHAHAEQLIGFYGEAFWHKELEHYGAGRA